MHRLLLIGILLATIVTSGAADEKPLPKKIEFELSLWQARLGLKKLQMRELRFAARGAASKLKEVMEAGEELPGDPWVALKSEKEPWVSLQLPRALKAKSFTKVAEALLSEQQLANLREFKVHAKKLRSESMQISRAHARVARLTKQLYLTESQRKKVLELSLTQARTRQQIAKKFKGREDQAPETTPLRQTPVFRALLDPNQRKLLTQREE